MDKLYCKVDFQKGLQDLDNMSVCDGIECVNCSATCDCVIELCIEDGPDDVTCQYCRVDAGEMDLIDVTCDECMQELAAR